MFVIYLLDSFHDNYNMPDSFYERFRLTGPELNRPVRFLNHRIGDPRILRLIRKWLNAGVLEDGVVSVGETGTGQGSVISPLLANVYLHYVFDLWAERWRRREARGDMMIVRYADDSAPRRREEGVM
jgi:hypothetical protein